jgi:hypothetical protein
MPERPRPVTRPLPIKLPLPLFLLPLLLRFQLRRSRLGVSRGCASIELDDFARANEELQLYRNADVTSEMAYQMWAHIHQERAASMPRIAEEGEKLARHAGTEPGGIKFYGRLSRFRGQRE